MSTMMQSKGSEAETAARSGRPEEAERSRGQGLVIHRKLAEAERSRGQGLVIHRKLAADHP